MCDKYTLYIPSYLLRNDQYKQQLIQLSQNKQTHVQQDRMASLSLTQAVLHIKRVLPHIILNLCISWEHRDSPSSH